MKGLSVLDRTNRKNKTNQTNCDENSFALELSTWVFVTGCRFHKLECQHTALATEPLMQIRETFLRDKFRIPCRDCFSKNDQDWWLEQLVELPQDREPSAP